MIASNGLYFDTTYIFKCYVTERGTQEIKRFLADSGKPVYSSLHGRAEFWASVTRQVREKEFSRVVMSHLLRDFEEHEAAGAWKWLPITDETIRAVCALLEQNAGKKGLVLRAADALHLASARVHGFTKIYSNDRHLLAAAGAFGLEGVDVIAGK